MPPQNATRADTEDATHARGQKVGYARVSTRGQSDDSQVDELNACGIDKLFIDHGISGKHAARPQLAAAMAYLREGDVLVITRLSRAMRSLKHLLTLAEDLQERGIGLVVLKQQVDTTTPTGRLVFHILAAIDEFQRELIVENTNEGLAAAKARGRVGGATRKLNDRQVATLLKMYDEEEPVPGQRAVPGVQPRMRRKHSVEKIAATFGVHKSTVHDYVRAHPDREGASATPMPRGRLGGSAPKLDADQAAALYAMYDAEVEGPDGTMVRAYTNAEIDEALGIHRTTRYRYLEQRRREQEQPAARRETAAR